MKKEKISKGFYEIGMSIILFIFYNIAVTNLFFIFKISISKLNLFISLAFTILSLIIILYKNKNSIKSIIIKIIIFLLLITFTIIISSNTYDLSWDGNSYHKTAIGELKMGWNPIYENIEEFNHSSNNLLELGGTHDIWCNNYAKGHWIFAANIYSLTNNIESGKSINFLMIIAVFCFSISYFIKKINYILSTIISLLLAINPITLMQMFTYYNDLLIYCFIVIMILLIANIFEENNNINYLILLFTLSILINIKFTGLAYAGIIMFIYYIYILCNKKLRKKELKKITILGILTVLIGIIFLGESTYIKNYVENGNPLYPLFGENKVDIMTTNQPLIFKDMSRVKKFIYSNFSESRNITVFQKENPTLKIPFTINEGELESLTIPDLRIGGFGVLFGGILLISIIIISVGLYFLYFKDRQKFNRIGIIVGILIFLILILEESWWARYMPQIYTIPIIAIIILYFFRERKINNILMYTIIVLMLANTGYIIKYNTITNIKRFSDIKTDLTEISKYDKIEANTSDFNGTMYNIYDFNKNLKIVKDVNSNDIELFYNNMIKVVQNDENKK